MKKNLAKKLVIGAILAASLGTMVGCSKTETTPDNATTTTTDSSKTVIGSLNGVDIYESDITETLNFMAAAYGITEEDKENWEAMRYSTISAFMNDKVCEEKAKELNISVSAEEVQAELDYTIAQYGGEEAYNEFLDSVGVTIDYIKTQMESQLLYNKVFEEITKDINVSADDVRTYFEEHPEEFITDETRDVYGIALESEDEAEKLLAELQEDKADFTAVANEKSKDNLNGDGFLGTVAQGDLMDQFDTEVFSLKEQGYVDKVMPMQVENAEGGMTTYYYVIKADNFVPSKTLTFEEVETDLTDMLMNEAKQAAYEEKFNTWKEEMQYKIAE